MEFDRDSLKRELLCLRLFGAVTRCLLPSRLLLSLIAILLLASFGRAWDAFAQPCARPAGLHAGSLDSNETERGRRELRTRVFAVLGRDAYAAAPDPALINADAAQRALDAAADSSAPALAAPGAYERLAQEIQANRALRPFEALSQAVRANCFGLARELLSLHCSGAVGNLKELLLDTPLAIFRAAPWFTVAFTLWSCLIIGLLGGAVCRMAVFDFGSQRAPSASEAVRWAQANLRSLAGAPLVGVAIAAVLLLIVWAVGLLSEVPFVRSVVAIGFGLQLMLALLAVISLTTLLLGLPLLSGAIATDRCDSVEAFQRCSAYVLGRPFHALCYAAVAVLAFSSATLIADWFAGGAFNLAVETGLAAPLRAVAGTMQLLQPESMPMAAPAGVSGVTIGALQFWRTLVSCLIGAAMLSCAVHLAQRTYMFLRLRNDGVALSEVD